MVLGCHRISWIYLWSVTNQEAIEHALINHQNDAYIKEVQALFFPQKILLMIS